MRFHRVVAIALVIAVTACQKKAPPAPSPGPDGVETIRGTERIGWDQRAADTAELATFRYAVYVDGARSEVTDTSCGSSAGTNGFACSGRLPSMSVGQHTIELATFVVDGSSTLESSRSTALRVNVTSSTTGARSDALRPGHAGTTSDGVQLQLDVVVEGLDEVSDIAIAADGRLFIAERNGRLRVIGERGHERSTCEIAGGILTLALDRFQHALRVCRAGFARPHRRQRSKRNVHHRAIPRGEWSARRADGPPPRRARQFRARVCRPGRRS
jgi:hypothetical protein